MGRGARHVQPPQKTMEIIFEHFAHLPPWPGSILKVAFRELILIPFSVMNQLLNFAKESACESHHCPSSATFKKPWLSSGLAPFIQVVDEVLLPSSFWASLTPATQVLRVHQGLPLGGCNAPLILCRFCKSQCPLPLPPPPLHRPLFNFGLLQLLFGPFCCALQEVGPWFKMVSFTRVTCRG